MTLRSSALPGDNVAGDHTPRRAILGQQQCPIRYLCLRTGRPRDGRRCVYGPNRPAPGRARARRRALRRSRAPSTPPGDVPARSAGASAQRRRTQQRPHRVETSPDTVSPSVPARHSCRCLTKAAFSSTISTRIPATFASSTSTSFGHFNRARPPGSTTSTASATASATTKPSSVSRDGGRCGRSRMVACRLPSALTHARPCRPRPRVCRRATTTVPSGAPSRARALASSIVEPSTAWCCTTKRGTTAAPRSRSFRSGNRGG